MNADDIGTTNSISEDPRYIAATKNGWGIEMIGIEATDGSNIDHAGIIGMAMTNFTIEASGIKKARVRNKRGRWLEYKTGFDKNDPLGDGTIITGIEIIGAGYIASVHAKGGSWLGSRHTSDTEGEVILGSNLPIDAIWIEKI